jgi:phage gp16-like protein
VDRRVAWSRVVSPREIIDARRKAERIKARATEAATSLEDIVGELLNVIEEQAGKIATLEARVAELESEVAS